MTISACGVLLFIAASCCHKPKIDSTEALMKAITERYYGKWYTQVNFSQTADKYENDSLVSSEIWDEVYQFPANLTIYLTPGDNSNLYICRNDSVLVYKNNEIESVAKITHDVIILSMDIYNMTLPDIMKRWYDMTYNISKFYEKTGADGKKIYVVGASQDNEEVNQVWFEAENLCLVKMIKYVAEGKKEVDMLDYIPLENKGWIEQGVDFKLNGKIYLKEKYFNIRIPETPAKQ